jgi:hypothetical protein
VAVYPHHLAGRGWGGGSKSVTIPGQDRTGAMHIKNSSRARGLISSWKSKESNPRQSHSPQLSLLLFAWLLCSSHLPAKIAA